MAKMHIDEEGMTPDNSDLLPFERMGEVNGVQKMVRIKYPAHITMAEEITAKSTGNQMLKLSLTIKHPTTDELVNIDDYKSYSKKAMKVPNNNISYLCDVFKLNKNDLDTDLFLDRWVWVTIKHEENKGQNIDEETGEYPVFVNNKISRYLTELTADEQKAVLNNEDLPF